MEAEAAATAEVLAAVDFTAAASAAAGWPADTTAADFTEAHGHGFGRGLGFGGFYGPYGYSDYDDYGYPYAYGDSYVDDGDCYVVQRRVHTTRGWRLRPVQVCG